MQPRQYFVYIVTNVNKTLYIGVTSDLVRRVNQHKNGYIEGFTSRYGIGTLVYVETFNLVLDGIAREKQLKNWSRSKKIALIERMNPNWDEIPLDL